MKNKKCIYLIGFMSSGKSTIGTLLAEKLSYIYIGTDEQIEKQEGLPIHSIFQKKGENYFRQIESKTLKELKCNGEYHGMVISTGGGLPCKNENLSFMKKHGVVVYLKSSMDDIIDRTGDGETRPVFQNLKQKGDIKKGIENLLKKRGKYYNKADIVIINSNNINPEKTAQRIIKMVGAI